MEHSQIRELNERFISWLEELARTANDDKATSGERSRSRAALAAFRRGLAKPPGEAVEMLRYIPPYIYSGSSRVMDTYLLIASLFASHPAPGGTGSIGSTLAAVKEDRDSDSIEARFVALLNCHDDDLYKHLRHAVALAKSGKAPVPVNWRRLLEDLRWWPSQRDRVRREWAKDFWGSQVTGEVDVENEAEDEIAQDH
jgi:CRISPR system Cascade subunit CasB